MVMKDKLTKTNHKKMYYRMRKIGIILSCGIALATIIAVPTYLSLSNSEIDQSSHAEEKKEEKKQNSEVLKYSI